MIRDDAITNISINMVFKPAKGQGKTSLYLNQAPHKVLVDELSFLQIIWSRSLNAD
jgi:hypothetical protein